jgi:hypothetical protein
MELRIQEGELACRLRRMTDKTLDRLKDKDSGGPRTDVVHPWEDVCVVIGAPGSTRTSSGDKKRGNRLKAEDFRKMLKVTLDFDPPKKIVRTAQGDLIRDPTYQGSMYLRGLLLPRGGTSGKSYAYGYNFVDGRTSRDRDTLSGSREEGKHIAAIWAAAIQADDSADSDLLTESTNLPLRFLNKIGDAFLSSDGNYLSEDIAKKVWRKMRTMDHNAQG